MIPIYQVDAFAHRPFEGNPAAVCPLLLWPKVEWMQKVAGENNLSETAFFVRKDHGFQLRWFTPVKEVSLCGHATLATAHVLYEEEGYNGDSIVFDTLSGILRVRRINNGRYIMDLPTDYPIEVRNSEVIHHIAEALQCRPISVWKGKDDLLVELQDQKTIEQLRPDFRAIATWDARGLIATAPGDSVHFVSRAFYPAYGIDEDPVTGSAHTILTPFWSARLRTNTLDAIQLSSRKGYLTCILKGIQVSLMGNAVTYMKGNIMC
ncbi:MAG TPA: PhzF family phenazine biosynthesis protein [Saprospiraceae bacterium]|nr:PhzF family phenazine biosynthesis protein [Saprospiraceae bacterium]